MATKRIGILTSGGDCGGLNAAIRGVVHRAVIGYGWEVVGIRDGGAGLAERPPRAARLTIDDVNTNVLRQGGTILGSTNKGDPFAKTDPEGKKLAEAQVEGLKQLGIEALVGIGGDGGLAVQKRLTELAGIPFVGIPKTMDNDVGITEVSIGYDTALMVATEALDRLQPTAASHSRIMVVEVMGRDAGHVALSAGLSGGADVILIPEIPWALERVVAHINSIQASGRNYALVVVSEAIMTEAGQRVMKTQANGKQTYGGVGDYVAQRLADATGAETRVTVLGHVLRGAPPTHIDRRIGQAFGVAAVDLIAAGKFSRVVTWQNRQVVDVPLDEVVATNQTVELKGTLVHTARALGICLGD